MELIRVHKGNVVLDVPADRRGEFLEKGFDILDIKTNEIVQAAATTDVKALQDEVAELSEKLAKALTELDTANKTIKKLKAKATK